MRCSGFSAFGGTGSTGRRNTGVKSLCWGFKLQGLSWPFVELTSRWRMAPQILRDFSRKIPAKTSLFSKSERTYCMISGIQHLMLDDLRGW
jgi:hypothetical protein